MWHEARKQERKIRGMLVDYRRRAERRQDFYEKIKADPTQFMQIHGRKCKIHLDPAVALLGDGAAIIVPWQGQKDNLIDRFDVRAHLDYIPPIQKASDLDELTTEERQCNYERYRILAQNDFLCLTEDKYLHQLYLEEQFGVNAQLENEQQRNTNKKPPNTGAAIGYTYEDSEPSAPFSHILNANPIHIPSAPIDDEEESDSDIDMDVSIEINKLDNSQAHDLNTCGRNYGMMSNDFYSFLVKDADEADAIRMAREEEQEKIMLSGRKSRRERRAQRERRCAGRPLSPPSYAAKEEPVENQNDNESDSRSPSPENSGKITYITSFGGEDELQPHSKISININKPQKSFGNSAMGQHGIDGGMTYADKVKANLEKLKQMNESSRSYRKRDSHSPKKPKQYLRSHSRSRSRSRYRRRRSRSYSRNHSRNRSRSRSRSRSGRGGRGYKDRRSGRRRTSHSRSNSRTRSYNRRRNYSRSRTPHKTSQSHYRPRRSASSSTSSSVDRRRRDRSRIITIKKKSPSPVGNTNHRSRSKSITKIPNLLFGTGESIIPNTALKSVGLSDTVPVLQQPSKVVPVQKTLTPPPQIPPVPIKRYYGRKRDNESSSSSSSDGDTEEDETNMETNENSNSNNFSPGTITNFNPPAIAAIASGSGNNSTIYGSNSGTIGSSAGNSSFLNNYSKSTVNPITSVSENKTLINIASTSSSSTANLRDRLKRKMQILLNKQYKADKKAEIERTERQIQQQQEREDEMRELALKLRRRQRELRHKYGTPTDSEDEEKLHQQITSTNNSPNEKEIIMELTKRSKSKSHDRERSRGRHRSRSSSRGYSRRRYRSHDRDRNHSPYNRSRRTSSGRSNRYRDRNHERKSRDRSRSRDYDRNERYRHRNGNNYSQNMSKSKCKQLVDY